MPRGQALDKLLSVLFSVDIKGTQDIQYRQCISSLVNVYSPCMRAGESFHPWRKEVI
jgi:hypothetical protein